jgi:hypothetical protein
VVYDGIWVVKTQKCRTPAVSATLSSNFETHQGAGDTLARRLLRGQLRLARRHWTTRSSSETHKLLGRCARMAQERPTDGPWKFETNHFGTNEFLRFCQLSGAEGYLAANVRGLTAQEFYEWIEYCNSPAGSTTGAERRAAGERQAAIRIG